MSKKVLLVFGTRLGANQISPLVDTLKGGLSFEPKIYITLSNLFLAVSAGSRPSPLLSARYVMAHPQSR